MNWYDIIDWDDADRPSGNTQHVADNGVSPGEFEDVLADPYGRDARSRTTGRRVRFGWTSTGKHLMVVFVLENDSGFRVVRPVTAFEVDP